MEEIYDDKKEKRFRNFMLMQQLEYLQPPYDTLNKLLDRINEIGAKKYAGILHDKDETLK